MTILKRMFGRKSSLRSAKPTLSKKAKVLNLLSKGENIACKTYYRLGTPTRAIIAAGIQALYGTKFKYSNWKNPVRKSELSPIN